ncbi:futalosine hydrolase [Paenibacillus sp. JSM ZJ436]|uniref:futalosine hydrolase n=1 Tax=Paenibacillus sp. JSM ZJ436 TaxID=3376190 RepID=UPI0037951333
MSHYEEASILIVTAVAPEQEAILRGLNGDDRFEVIAAGVGPAAAAAATARVLASGGGRHRLVISAGIGGGFDGQAGQAGLVVADRMIAADLGAESPGGFLSVDELGFGSSTIAAPEPITRALTEALNRAGLQAVCGPILTVSTATGTAETAAARSARIPLAAAEAMEGFGAAQAAADVKLPVLELRAISNRVGLRDREAWDIPGALKHLEAASSILTEVV